MAGSMTSGKFWHSEAWDVRGAMYTLRGIAGFFLLSILPVCGFAQQEKLPADDLPQNFKAPVQQTDFDKRVDETLRRTDGAFGGFDQRDRFGLGGEADR